MRRALNFLLRNWPLKLGAILLATVLYTGLVLAQNVRTFTGAVPVDTIRPPVNAALLSDLESVTEVRYRAPLDVSVLSPDVFRATVDLSRVEARVDGPPAEVPVTVTALDQRVSVIDWQPRVLQVRLDPIEVRLMDVNVPLGNVPDGLNVGPPQTEPSTVSVRGAVSRVASIRSIVARVTVDASALNIDRDVELVPIDENGNQVPNVEIEPERARVRVAVARQLANISLPVVPQLTGEIAPGHRISSITHEPLVVTVSGEESIVGRLETAMTEPIDVSGRTNDLETTVRFALPDGVSVSGSDLVRVLLTIEEETGTRTFPVGVQLVGSQQGRNYGLGTGQVNVTLGGTLAQLDELVPASLVAQANVGPFGVGSHLVRVMIEPPPGMTVVAVSPSQVLVEIESALPQTAPPAEGAQLRVAAGGGPTR